MRSLIVLVLPILLFSGCESKSSFEGKWLTVLPGPQGDSDTNLVCEFKTDGTMEMITNIDGKDLSKLIGKWKKTGDKSIELAIDNEPKKSAKGVLIDGKTLELTSSDSDKEGKIKFTRQ